MDVEKFDKMKSQDRFKTFDGAEANKKFNECRKVTDVEYHSFEATLGRILEVVSAMNPQEKPIIHPKHQFFGGGCTMSERFRCSAFAENDELQVYKATRDALRPRRPQSAPAGGRSSAIVEAAPPRHVAPGQENQSVESQTSAIPRGSKSASLLGVQRPKSAMDIGRSRCPSSIEVDVQQRPSSAGAKGSTLTRSRSMTNASSGMNTRTSREKKQPCAPVAAEWLGGNLRANDQRPKQIKTSQSAKSQTKQDFPRRPPRVRSKARAKLAKAGDPFFPLCKEFNLAEAPGPPRTKT